MPRKQKKAKKSETVIKDPQVESGSQENSGQDPSRATVRSLSKLRMVLNLEEQLAAAHNSSIDFHANLKNAIALMQQVVLQYDSRIGFNDELSSIRIILNRMTQMSLYLDVYSDYVQFLFCEGLIDADHCDLAINGIQQTMERAIVFINAANLIMQKVHLKEQGSGDD